MVSRRSRLSLPRMDGRGLLAWNLKKLRFEQQLSQERIAVDAQIDRAYISEIERSQKAATVDVLDRLAAALNVPISALFDIPAEDASLPSNLAKGRRPG